MLWYIISLLDALAASKSELSLLREELGWTEEDFPKREAQFLRA